MTYIHTSHTYILTYLRTYILTYLHAYILTYLHTYIHTYVHAHTGGGTPVGTRGMRTFRGSLQQIAWQSGLTEAAKKRKSLFLCSYKRENNMSLTPKAKTLASTRWSHIVSGLFVEGTPYWCVKGNPKQNHNFKGQTHIYTDLFLASF